MIRSFMEVKQLEEIMLIGLTLPEKTSNVNNQSSRDCGTLWQKFEQEDYVSQIPGKVSDDIYAVYYQYEGDHKMPFSYFIGCKVHPDTVVPDDMQSMKIPSGRYRKYLAKGIIPECIAAIWQRIWETEQSRAYLVDYEVYDHRSKDWSNGEVPIFISLP